MRVKDIYAIRPASIGMGTYLRFPSSALGKDPYLIVAAGGQLAAVVNIAEGTRFDEPVRVVHYTCLTRTEAEALLGYYYNLAKVISKEEAIRILAK